jgi:hypothetical protein
VNINAGTGSSSITATGNNDTIAIGQGTGTVSASGSNETIRFGSGILKDTVAFYLDGNNLKIGFAGDSNSEYTIYNQGDANPSVANMTLSDGEYLTNVDVNLLIQQMSSYAADHQGIAFTSLNDVKNSPDLMNIISNSWHAA